MALGQALRPHAPRERRHPAPSIILVTRSPWASSWLTSGGGDLEESHHHHRTDHHDPHDHHHREPAADPRRCARGSSQSFGCLAWHRQAMSVKVQHGRAAAGGHRPGRRAAGSHSEGNITRYSVSTRGSPDIMGPCVRYARTPTSCGRSADLRLLGRTQVNINAIDGRPWDHDDREHHAANGGMQHNAQGRRARCARNLYAIGPTVRPHGGDPKPPTHYSVPPGRPCAAHRHRRGRRAHQLHP